MKEEERHEQQDHLQRMAQGMATDTQIALLVLTTNNILSECKAIREEQKKHAEQDDTKFKDIEARCVELKISDAKTDQNLAWTQRIGGFVITALAGAVAWVASRVTWK